MTKLISRQCEAVLVTYFFISLKLLLETIFYFFPPADSSAPPPNFRPVESLMEYLLFFSLKCKLWEFAFKAMGRKHECVCTCFQWWFAACRVESQGQSTIPRRTLETDESYFRMVSRLMAALRRTPLSAELRRKCHNWKPGATRMPGRQEPTFGDRKDNSRWRRRDIWDTLRVPKRKGAYFQNKTQ